MGTVETVIMPSHHVHIFHNITSHTADLCLYSSFKNNPLRNTNRKMSSKRGRLDQDPTAGSRPSCGPHYLGGDTRKPDLTSLWSAHSSWTGTDVQVPQISCAGTGRDPGDILPCFCVTRVSRGLRAPACPRSHITSFAEQMSPEGVSMQSCSAGLGSLEPLKRELHDSPDTLALLVTFFVFFLKLIYFLKP